MNESVDACDKGNQKEELKENVRILMYGGNSLGNIRDTWKWPFITV